MSWESRCVKGLVCCKTKTKVSLETMIYFPFFFLFLLPFTLLIIHVFLLVSSIYKHPFLFSNRQSRIVFFCF